MLQQEVYIITSLLMVLDALCVVAAGYMAYFLKRIQSEWLWSMDMYIFTISVFIVMVGNNYTMGKLKLYSDKRPDSYVALYLAIFKALLPVFGVLTFGIFSFQLKDYSRYFILYFAGLSFIFIVAQRSLIQFFFDQFAYRRLNRHHILVVGDLQVGEYMISLLRSQLSWGHEIVGHLSVDRREVNPCNSLGCIDDLAEIIKQHTIDEVIFAICRHRNLELSTHIETCKKMGVFIRILPTLWCTEGARLSVDICQKVPFLTIGANNFNATGILYKRLLDIAGGLFGCVFFFLIYPVVAAAIRLDTPGPVIFKQQRMGQHGRRFDLYKFRSMYADAEQRLRELQAHNEMNGAMFKMKDDPRITRVGRWLRKTSIDEVPQFLNVLKGEMSLVGTRPPTCKEVESYRDEHLKRISLKPGLTGLWQVSGRNKITDFDQVVGLDCAYMENWRFIDDLKILGKTIWVVLQRKGAI